MLTGGVDHYEVVVTCAANANPPDQGSCGQPINTGTATTIALTGLSNSAEYTFTVHALDGSQTLIANSNTVSLTLFDHYIFLPLIEK